MKQLRRLLLGILFLGLCACSMFKLHQVKIQQGNIMTQKMIHQLKPGMTKPEVQAIMGTPVMINTFKDNRTHYIYTFQKGNKLLSEKRLVIYFKNNRLTEFKATGF